MPDLTESSTVLLEIENEPSVEEKLKIFAKHFSLFSRIEKGVSMHVQIPVFCVCKYCRKNFTDTEKLLFSELYHHQLYKLKTALDTAGNFEKKISAWLFHFDTRKTQFFKVDVDEIKFALAPTTHEEIRQANLVFYELYRKLFFNTLPPHRRNPWYMKDFESRKRFRQQHVQAGKARTVEDEIEQLYADYSNSPLAATSLTLLESLLNGNKLQWDNYPWDDDYTINVVFAHEAYLYIRFLKGKLNRKEQ